VREARVLGDLCDAMTRVDAFQPEPPSLAIEAEQAAIGHQRDRPTGAIDIRVASARRTDEGNPLNQSAPRMFGSEQYHLRHHIIEICGAERAGKTDMWPLIVPDANEVDIAGSVDLASRQKEYVDAALAGTVEQLAPAIGEKIVLAALQQRY